MRISFLLISFIFTGVISAQTKFANIKTFQSGKFPYDKFSTCANTWGSEINCATYLCSGDLIELSLVNCDPEGSDSLKEATINKMAEEISNIISTASCNTGKSYFIQVGEGIFIKSSDNLSGNTYFKKAWKLNLQRFMDKFGKPLSEAFPNVKIYVEDWGW